MKMKRSGTLFSFFCLGVIVEMMFLLLASTQIVIPWSPVMFMNIIVCGIIFSCYRLAFDWKYFQNTLSRELRKLYIRQDPAYQLSFAIFGSFFVFLANLNFLALMPYQHIAALGFSAVIVGANVWELHRRQSIENSIAASAQKFLERGEVKPCQKSTTCLTQKPQEYSPFCMS